MDTTWAAGITAAAGTGLTRPLFHLLFTQMKRFSEENHSESLCHAFAHCKSFAPAAPRRARVLISVPFWGLQLSLPLSVIGLVSRYLTNSLIDRSPIVKPTQSNSWADLGQEAFQISRPMWYCPQFLEVIPLLTVG